MPCTDGRENVRVEYRDSPLNKDLKDRLDEVTDLLCKTMNRLEDIGLEFKLEFYNMPELLFWWKEHKELDEQKREEKKRRLRQKLEVTFTPEEIAVLKQLI